MESSQSKFVISDADVDYFLEKTKVILNIDLTNYKQNFLNRRIAIRMYANNLHSISEYVLFIKKNPDEISKMIQSLSINVTEFFRDRSVFEKFKLKLLPSMTNQKKFSNNIRILSLGCATGEEVYSIAICLKQFFNHTANNVSVTGIDLNRNAIEFAKIGIYDEASLKNVTSHERNLFFEKHEKSFRIVDSLKFITSFHKCNIYDYQSPIKFDFVFCRNLLIYLNRDTQIKIFEKIHDLLSPQGYLIVGTSETITGKASKLFSPYDIQNRIFKKI